MALPQLRPQGRLLLVGGRAGQAVVARAGLGAADRVVVVAVVRLRLQDRPQEPHRGRPAQRRRLRLAGGGGLGGGGRGQVRLERRDGSVSFLLLLLLLVGGLEVGPVLVSLQLEEVVDQRQLPRAHCVVPRQLRLDLVRAGGGGAGEHRGDVLAGELVEDLVHRLLLQADLLQLLGREHFLRPQGGQDALLQQLLVHGRDRLVDLLGLGRLLAVGLGLLLALVAEGGGEQGGQRVAHRLRHRPEVLRAQHH